jgi:hypothetical protein
MLKPHGNHFIPCRVNLVRYIRPSWTFSSDSRDLTAALGWTYLTQGQIYPTSRIYPVSIRLQSQGSRPDQTYPTPGRICPTYQIYPSLVGLQYRITPL